ncbi:MAG: asparagine synthase (glutamine-hydrolyzing) [Campylobacterota bacterium]
MCGVLGSNFISKKFEGSLSLLKNRGVDNQSSYIVDNNQFGHTRLSIIDLDIEANQPMVFNDIVLVFNGEIYNYKDLIKSENLICTTKSDSEVLIRLYEKYGFDFLNKLNGMFAFCIYDIKKQRFFCARDRYGKKPLFFYFKDKKFIFSSLIKPIVNLLDKKPALNKVALSKYMQYFASFGKDTFFQDIYKLDAGSFLVYEPNKKSNSFYEKKFYKIKTKKKVFDEQEALEKIEELLFDSVNSRLKSDVNMGCLLSGGIDSSLISAVYSKLSNKQINTFSIGYSEYKNYCELDYANILSKHINSNHTAVEISKADFIENFESTLDILEQPHADSAAIPLNILTKKVSSCGVRTLLSGEGSDEIFLGYDNYSKFYRYYEFKDSLSQNQNEFLNGIISSLKAENKESEYLRRVIKKENLYNSFGEIYTQPQKKRLFKKVPTYKTEKPKDDPIDWMSYIDLKIWLGEVLLPKVDKISMNNSLETRTPFLDYKLVDYMFSVDSKLKLGDTNKYLLKKIALKYIPSEIITRQKKGFNSPYHEWLQKEYKDYIIELILEVNSKTDLFNKEYILYIYELSLKNKFKQHLYALFVFSLWYKKEFLS